MTNTTQKQHRTVITLVLPAEGEDKPASLAIKQDEIGQVSTFIYSDFAAICRALNTGLGRFTGVLENPPGDVESAAKKAKAKSTKKSGKDKKKSTKKEKPAGKPPYHLITATGKRRELMMMTDPFEVTEKCMKNKKMVFKDLTDAEEIAQMLVDAGETSITIAFKNGNPAKVIGEQPSETDSEVEATSESAKPDTDDTGAEDGYPDEIDDTSKQALYDHLQDTDLTLAIHDEVQKTKQHDWTNNLMKQRMVKGAIHKHVDEDKVEAIYDIFFNIDHVPTDTEDEPEDTSEEPADPQKVLI